MSFEICDLCQCAKGQEAAAGGVGICFITLVYRGGIFKALRGTGEKAMSPCPWPGRMTKIKE